MNLQERERKRERKMMMMRRMKRVERDEDASGRVSDRNLSLFASHTGLGQGRKIHPPDAECASSQLFHLTCLLPLCALCCIMAQQEQQGGRERSLFPFPRTKNRHWASRFWLVPFVASSPSCCSSCCFTTGSLLPVCFVKQNQLL